MISWCLVVYLRVPERRLPDEAMFIHAKPGDTCSYLVEYLANSPFHRSPSDNIVLQFPRPNSGGKSCNDSHEAHRATASATASSTGTGIASATGHRHS